MSNETLSSYQIAVSKINEVACKENFACLKDIYMPKSLSMKFNYIPELLIKIKWRLLPNEQADFFHIRIMQRGLHFVEAVIKNTEDKIVDTLIIQGKWEEDFVCCLVKYKMSHAKYPSWFMIENSVGVENYAN